MIFMTLLRGSQFSGLRLLNKNLHLLAGVQITRIGYVNSCELIFQKGPNIGWNDVKSRV